MTGSTQLHAYEPPHVFPRGVGKALHTALIFTALPSPPTHPTPPYFVQNRRVQIHLIGEQKANAHQSQLQLLASARVVGASVAFMVSTEAYIPRGGRGRDREGTHQSQLQVMAFTSSP